MRQRATAHMAALIAYRPSDYTPAVEELVILGKYLATRFASSRSLSVLSFVSSSSSEEAPFFTAGEARTLWEGYCQHA